MTYLFSFLCFFYFVRFFGCEQICNFKAIGFPVAFLFKVIFIQAKPTHPSPILKGEFLSVLRQVRVESIIAFDSAFAPEGQQIEKNVA